MPDAVSQLLADYGLRLPRGKAILLDGTAANTVIQSELTGGASFTDSLASDLIVKEPNGQRILFGTQGATAAQASTASIDGTFLNAKGLAISGVLGPTVSSRYLGAVTGGAPVTGGPFIAGDWVVETTGGFWVCNIGGTAIQAGWVFVGSAASKAPRVIGASFTTNTSWSASTAIKACSGSQISVTAAKDCRVYVRWVLDCNSTTNGFGFAYLAPQLDGTALPGAPLSFISGAPRAHIEITSDVWVAGGTHTFQISSNNGIASGKFDVNVDANAGGSSAYATVYDQ